MSLTPPRVPSFVLASALGISGVLGQLGHFALAAPYAFWLVAAGFVVLLVSTVFRGL